MALSLQRYTWSDNHSVYRTLIERIKEERERSVKREIANGEHLPENMIIEILSWLPVKDLLKFKSVCKSWYAIIASPNFVSQHMKNYYNHNDSWRECLLAQYFVSDGELQLHELLVDDTPRISASVVLYKMPNYRSFICGPCDGIYFLWDSRFSKRGLWNPAINEFRALPPLVTKPDLPSNLKCDTHDEVYGFGLDAVSKDYKVIVIKGYWTECGRSSHPLSVFIYSLMTSSWRYWGDLAGDYFLENNKCYIFVNQCLYWMGLRTRYDTNSEIMISFNMASDTFQEIPLPDYENPASNCLGVYHDSFAFYTVHKIANEFSIWTWTEGVWTRRFTVVMSRFRNPVGHWRNNKVVLECLGRKLVLCDLETKEIRNLAFERYTNCEGVYAYMESLVSIKDHNTHESEV